MSYDPSFQTGGTFISTNDIVRFDDIQYYADLASINALLNKNIQITYVANDTANRYRWDGITLHLLISGGGSVSSVSKTGNTILVNNTNPNAPVISTVQELDTTASPSFTNVNVLTAPSSNTHLTNKLYVDTANNLDLKKASNLSDLQSVSTAKVNLQLNNVANTFNNFTAIVPPTASNDSTQGYTVSSRWIDTVLNKHWVCVNASIGASVWIKGGASFLDELDDVDTAGVQTTDALTWDGVKWAPATTSSTMDITNSLLLQCDLNALFSGNTTVLDSSAYASVGTLEVLTVANLVPAKLSNGINFTANNQRIGFGTTSNQLKFSQTSDFTASFWFSTTENAATERALFGSGTGVNGNGWWTTWQSNLNRLTFKMACISNTNNLEVRWDLGAGVANTGAFNFFTFVKRGGVDSADVDFYFNGVNREDVKVMVSESLTLVDSIETITPFYIGDLTSGYANLRGTIDMLNIFNFPFVDSTVKSLYNNGAGTATYANVLTIIDHVHKISDVINLQTTLNTKIDTLTSTHGFVVNVSGTGTSRSLDIRTGSNIPLLYTAQSPSVNGSQIGFNSGAMATTTSINLGWQPVNRSIYKSDYVRYHMDTHLSTLPCKLLLIDANNNANRAIFNINSFGTGGFDYTLSSVSYLSGSGTPPTTNGTEYHAILYHDIPTTASQLTNDATGRTYAIGANVDLALDGVDARLITNTSSITQLNTSVSRIDLEKNRNLLTECELAIIGQSFVPTISSFNAILTSSRRLVSNYPDGYNSMKQFTGRVSHRLLNQNTNNNSICYYAIRFSAPSWQNDTITSTWCGFISEECNMESFTSNFQLGHNGIYNSAATSKDRMFWCRFTPTGAECSAPVPGTPMVRTQYIGPVNATLDQNDIIIAFMDTQFYYNIRWYSAPNGYALKAEAKVLSPAPSHLFNNFHSSKVLPCFSCYGNSPTWFFDIMSERDLLTLGVVPPTGGFCYFY